MDRRIVLSGFAAALAAGPALAQGTAGPAAGSSAMPAMPGMAGPMGQAEMQHTQDTLRVGSMALETSRLAAQKARNAELKQFAGFEVAEQTTIAEVLHSMMDPAATGATRGAMPAPALDAKGREMVQKLSAADGAAFDREYHRGQLEGHRELLQIQERYLQGSPQNREHMNVAKLARGHIKEHIAVLEDMQQKMR